MAQWANLRADHLCALLPGQPRRLPCQATYGNVLKELDSEHLAQVLQGYFRWRATHTRCQDEPSHLLGQDGKQEHAHVALDGKTPRGTLGHLDEQQAPVHLLSFYEVSTGIVLGQRQVSSKQNEYSAVKEWVRPTFVKDRIVSADATHTHAALCADVVRFGGHYLLAVKKNQPHTYEDLQLFFGDQEAQEEDWRQTETWNKGHGRLEWRQLTCSTQLNEYFAQDWPGLGQVFRVHRRLTRPLSCSQHIVYGITSLSPAQAGPERLLALLRALKIGSIGGVM